MTAYFSPAITEAFKHVEFVHSDLSLDSTIFSLVELPLRPTRRIVEQSLLLKKYDPGTVRKWTRDKEDLRALPPSHFPERDFEVLVYHNSVSTSRACTHTVTTTITATTTDIITTIATASSAIIAATIDRHHHPRHHHFYYDQSPSTIATAIVTNAIATTPTPSAPTRDSHLRHR